MPKTSLKKLAIVGANFTALTGNTLAIEPHPERSEVLLRITTPTGAEAGIGYYPNHVAEAILSALTYYDGAIKHTPGKQFMAPSQALGTTHLFLPPGS